MVSRQSVPMGKTLSGLSAPAGATRRPSFGAGELYLNLRAGRPNWQDEFKTLAARYGREDIGVIFCGAPMIAAALKEACEDNSQKDKTIFRLHKENF